MWFIGVLNSLGLLRWLLLVFDFFWLWLGVRLVFVVWFASGLYGFLLILLCMILLVLWFVLLFDGFVVLGVTVCERCCRVNSVVAYVLIVWFRVLHCYYFDAGIGLYWLLVVCWLVVDAGCNFCISCVCWVLCLLVIDLMLMFGWRCWLLVVTRVGVFSCLLV